MSFSWGPCFGLLVIFALDFKSRVDPSLAYFVTCIQWLPQHLSFSIILSLNSMNSLNWVYSGVSMK